MYGVSDGELGGAGVDALVDRVQAEPRAAAPATCSLVDAGKLAEPRIGKAHLLQPQQARSGRCGSPSRRTRSSASTISRMRSRNHGS